MIKGGERRVTGESISPVMTFQGERGCGGASTGLKNNLDGLGPSRMFCELGTENG